MQPISNDRKSPYRCGQVRKDPNLTPAGFTRKPVSVQRQVDLSDVVSPLLLYIGVHEIFM